MKILWQNIFKLLPLIRRGIDKDVVSCLEHITQEMMLCSVSDTHALVSLSIDHDCLFNTGLLLTDNVCSVLEQNLPVDEETLKQTCLCMRQSRSQ